MRGQGAVMILVLLASCSCQPPKNCSIQLESTRCAYHRLRDFIKNSKIKTNTGERILIFHNHFAQLKEKQKVCLLRKIFQFYNSVLKTVVTAKVSKAEISTLRDDLQWFDKYCIQCERCNKVVNRKERLEKPYSKSMNLNGTAIMRYQMQRLNRAQKKLQTNLAEIQEKAIFELAIFWGFLDVAK